jgi:hypothetical protein
MKEVEISKVEVLQSGEILVTPVINLKDLFQFIYRTATGVTWNESSQSFMSPTPREWTLFDWYKSILDSVVSEMDVLLKVTPITEWQNVPQELQESIKSYVAAINT